MGHIGRDNMASFVDDELPEAMRVVTMSDEDFAGFEDRVRDSIKDRKAFDQLLAEALWDEDKIPQRMPSVVRALMGLVQEIVKRNDDIMNYMEVKLPGVLIMETLFRMSCCRSWSTVVVRKAAADAPCVFISGSAGSHVNEMKPQMDFYEAQGFTVIACTAAHFPTRIQQRQAFKLARELRNALANGNKFVMHCCSGHGMAHWNNVLHAWKNGKQPFDKLPAVTECLTAMVFECWGMTPFFYDDNPAFKEFVVSKCGPHALETVSPRNLEEIDIVKDLETVDDAGFLFGAQKCLIDLLGEYSPEIKWHSEPRAIKLLFRLCNSGYRVHSQLQHRSYVSDEPCGPIWGYWNDIFYLDMEMNPPIPRLIMAGKEDKMKSDPMLTSDAFWTINKKTKQICQEIDGAGHMECWQADNKKCKEVIKSLFKVAKLKPPGKKK